jgi:hypothetical protein
MEEAILQAQRPQALLFQGSKGIIDLANNIFEIIT